MDIRQTIGKRIHRLRRQMDLTQQGLAERIGVNASYIGPLEKGLKCPSITVLQKLAQELGQPVFSFFLDDRADARDEGEGDRVMALLASHPTEERRFILRMVEEMSTLLKSQREGSTFPGREGSILERKEIEANLGLGGEGHTTHLGVSAAS
jgi:transcriptional regulator with XRE-family HTH domain